ncbi:MAG TPA: helix-turn-helix domain-containing protein [Clostridiales bacterium]|nr:helix-turn-helix domain-containing protein [Clostridiales bacterium]
MFNNFNLTNQEILTIIDNYKNLINRYATVDGKLDEDLEQEIKLLIFKVLSKNRKIEKN